MAILIFKIIHFVFFVSWFAAMFYLGRMFVYHVEAFEKPEPDQSILIKQIGLMEWRVYRIIMNPAMIITWIAGLAMIYLYGWEWFKINTWLHFKILFLIVVSGYHGYSKGVIKKLENGIIPMTPMQSRLFNEIPTVMLILIVSLAVMKNMTNPMILIGSILIIIALLITFTKLYKSIREKNSNS
ncbi:MAG TPA: CopD family protein [Saprospiraceae bacterium]|nr:CopD family protein [Saprospiraceae bacterium]